MFALDFSPLIIFAAAAILSFMIAIISLILNWPLKIALVACISLSFFANFFAFPHPEKIMDIIITIFFLFIGSAIPCLIGVGIPALIGKLFGSNSGDRSSN